MGDKGKDGINPWLVLGGLALIDKIFDSGEKQVVHVDSSDYDDREMKRLKKEEELIARKEELEKAKFPNSIENIKERVEKDSMAAIFGLSAMICICLGALGAMGIVSGELDCIPLTVFFAGGAYILYKLYQKLKAKIDVHMEYISLIIIHGERSIIKIANTMNKSYEQTLKDITNIISKDYIKGFYVNKSTKMIEYGNLDGGVRKMQKNYGYDNATQENKSKCPSCGASKIIEINGEEYCKYCGTRL